MIVDSFEEEDKKINPLLFRVVILMGLATSIDALAVGVSLAFIEVDIYEAIIIIGMITFLTAMVGMLIGKSAVGRLGKRVGIIGGLILFGIGLNILIEHIG